MLVNRGMGGGINAGQSFFLPLGDAGSGAVNTTPVSAFGDGTPTFTRATTAWISLDGAAPGVDTTGTLPAQTQINIGTQVAGVNALFGTIRNVRIWTRQLTDEQLQGLTS